jgi:hypothetical protein
MAWEGDEEAGFGPDVWGLVIGEEEFSAGTIIVEVDYASPFSPGSSMGRAIGVSVVLVGRHGGSWRPMHDVDVVGVHGTAEVFGDEGGGARCPIFKDVGGLRLVLAELMAVDDAPLPVAVGHGGRWEAFEGGDDFSAFGWGSEVGTEDHVGRVKFCTVRYSRVAP